MLLLEVNPIKSSHFKDFETFAQNLFFNFSLLLIDSLWCSSWFPMVTGQALGVVGRRLVSHFPFFQTLQGKSANVGMMKSCSTYLPIASRVTPATVGYQQVKIGIQLSLKKRG